MGQADRRLQEEHTRVRTYLHAPTGPKLLDILHKTLIEDKAKTLVTVWLLFVPAVLHSEVLAPHARVT